MDGRRIGAYGGTFDPFHNAHLEVARAIARKFELEALLIIPAHVPPHKQGWAISNAFHRYTMAVIATADEPRMKVSAMELEAPDKPYTFETIERLRGVYGGNTQLFFIMGADSFEELKTWRCPERIIANADLIVAARPGYDARRASLPGGVETRLIDLRGAGGGPTTEIDKSAHRVYITDYVNIDSSATEIRQRVRDRRPIAGEVPARVADYIEKYELYRR